MDDFDRFNDIKLLGTGFTGYVFKVTVGTEQYAVKIRKHATRATTYATDDGASEGGFLETLFHKNIVKFIGRTSGPLPDAFIQHIPEGEQAPFKKQLRAGGRRPVNGLLTTYHATKLFDYVDKSRTIDLKPCIVNVLAGLLSAAEHMLSKGVLHLDLKDDNVLIDESGQPVVIDFGHCVEYNANCDTMIMPKLSVGNCLHCPPELRTILKKNTKGGRVSGEKFIVFSMGVLVAECISEEHEHPFEQYDAGEWEDDEPAEWGKHEGKKSNDSGMKELVGIVADMMLVDPDSRLTILEAMQRMREFGESEKNLDRGIKVPSNSQRRSPRKHAGTPSSTKSPGVSKTLSFSQDPSSTSSTSSHSSSNTSSISAASSSSALSSRSPPRIESIEEDSAMVDAQEEHVAIEYHRNLLGFKAWRGKQKEVIMSVLSGCDTLYVEQTGGGKTLPGLVAGLILVNKHLKGKCSNIIVGPTVALCEQHVETANTLLELTKIHFSVVTFAGPIMRSTEAPSLTGLMCLTLLDSSCSLRRSIVATRKNQNGFPPAGGDKRSLGQ
jgi:serine/threonine protein kinase